MASLFQKTVRCSRLIQTFFMKGSSKSTVYRPATREKPHQRRVGGTTAEWELGLSVVTLTTHRLDCSYFYAT